MNVILFSLYCLLPYLSLVMLSLLLCECHLVFPLLSFFILMCFPSIAFCHVLSCFVPLLSFVILILCECHLVFPLLPFVILITCYVKYAPMWMSSCLPSIVFSFILITCYVKFAPMWMSSCFPSIAFCHTYHLLC